VVMDAFTHACDAITAQVDVAKNIAKQWCLANPFSFMEETDIDC